MEHRQEQLMIAARALSQAGNRTGAIAKLREFLTNDPTDPHALTFLAALESDAGHKDKAGELIEDALQHAPNDPHVHHVKGHILIAQKKLKQAIQVLEEALRLDPQAWRSHYYLALAHDEGDDHRRAEQHYLEALRLAPEEPEILNGYADFLTQRGRLADAKALIAHASEIGPDDEDNLFARARIALHEGRLSEALDLTLWILRSDATDPRALNLLAQIKMRRNPILGIWWRWAVFTSSMSTGMRWATVIGLYIVWQIFARTILARMPSIVSTPIIFAWLGFCVLTWVGPTILDRMVKRELRKVQVKPTF